MSEQEKHIERLKELSTLNAGKYAIDNFLVNVSGRDVIDAGRRLEELDIYKFEVGGDEEKIKRFLNIRDSIIDIYYRHLHKKDNVLILEGSSRSGKTNNKMRDAIVRNMYYPYNLNVIAPSYKMLNLGSFIDAKNIIQEFEVKCKLPANATEIKFPLGGKITFEVVTSENEAKRNRDNIFINEADGIEESVANLIIGRAHGQTTIDYNPTKKFWSEKYKTKTNFLHTTFEDNPFLSENQKIWFKNLYKFGHNAPKGSPERYAYEVYYLGKYSSLAHNVFRNGDFKYWDVLPPDFDVVFSYADPSLGVGADFFAGGLFGIKNKQVYLLDSIFSEYETAETYLKKMMQWDKLYKCEHFIETNGFGKLIFTKIKNNYNGLLNSVSNHDNKNGDIILYSPEAKQVLYNQSDITEEMIKQCIAFPDAEHDDAPDMFCRAQKIIEKYFIF